MTDKDIIQYLKKNVVIEVSIMSNVIQQNDEDTQQILNGYDQVVKGLRKTLVPRYVSSVTDKGFMG